MNKRHQQNIFNVIVNENLMVENVIQRESGINSFVYEIAKIT